MSCPLQSPLDGSELMVWGIFICCTAQSKKPLTGAAPRSTVPKCSSRFLCNTEAPNIWLMLLQGANPAGKEPALLPTHAQAARGWTEEPWLGQRGQDWVGAVLGHAGSSRLSSPSPARALTALIFFHCRSSSALSFVSLKRRVLRPSDILMPYWKAALEKEQDMAQHSQGIHSLPEEGTHLPSHEHMLQSWPEPLKAVWAGVLKSNTKSKNKPPGPGLTAPPQVIIREHPACFKLPQHPGLASGTIPPRTLARPFLRAVLTWAEPPCCSCTRCTPPAYQSPSGPEAPSCYPAGRE